MLHGEISSKNINFLNISNFLIDLILGFELQSIQKIKRRAERFLKAKVYNELNDIHYVSTFLYPSFKELLVLSPTKRDGSS